MFCPQCGAEYREEFDRCADCEVALVAELPAEPPTPEPVSFVTIAQFRDLPEAFVAAGRLEADGFTVALADQHFIALDWRYSVALGGVKLKVAEAEATAATAVLETDHSSMLLEVERESGAPDESCRRCGSSAVISVNTTREAAAYFMLLGSTLSLPVPAELWVFGCAAFLFLVVVPAAFRRTRWKCGQCGFMWRPIHPLHFKSVDETAPAAPAWSVPPGLAFWILWAIMATAALLVVYSYGQHG